MIIPKNILRKPYNHEQQDFNAIFGFRRVNFLHKTDQKLVDIMRLRWDAGFLFPNKIIEDDFFKEHQIIIKPNISDEFPSPAGYPFYVIERSYHAHTNNAPRKTGSRKVLIWFKLTSKSLKWDLVYHPIDYTIMVDKLKEIRNNNNNLRAKVL